MSINLYDYEDGFYLLKDSNNIENDCLVKVYTFLHEDEYFRVIGFGVWDGGGTLFGYDVIDTSYLIPVKIHEQLN